MLSLKDTGNATYTIMGDQHAPLSANGHSYDWTKAQYHADGTLVGGVAETNFSDALIGGNVKNKILGLGTASGRPDDLAGELCQQPESDDCRQLALMLS
ncbi:hypothetical protein [Massilia aquatica]|uniref:Uncharacterized protein n=1 Tax=Massilia aquatica TaxID=2609000 RepID=A0ABX0M4B2_9BURK|nr:hypothetical protein [Massilia aquatica]NHZ41094.1 hypothetical protein [Massilia aquatica]